MESRSGDGGQDLFQELRDLLRKGKQTRPSAFLGHRPERTAEVPVHIRVAHIAETAPHVNEILGAVAEDLGLDAQSELRSGSRSRKCRS
jgi:hypothetical protein